MCFCGVSTSLRRGWGRPPGGDDDDDDDAVVAVVVAVVVVDIEEEAAPSLLLLCRAVLSRLPLTAAKTLPLPDLLCGGPTGMMRDPNSTPMVTSCWALKRPSHNRMVRDDLPHPESPMQTSLAM